MTKETRRKEEGFQAEPGTAGEFRRKWRLAFGDLVESDRYCRLLADFEKSYHQRRQLNWLGESHEDGLGQAVKRAMAGYSPWGKRTQRIRPTGNPTREAERFKEEMAGAEQVVLGDPLALERFERLLATAGFNAQHSSVDDLTDHIARALRYYVRTWRAGTSIEPW